MEFKETSTSNMLDGVVREINFEGSFASIPIELDNENYRRSDFMKVFPKELLVQGRPSWKGLSEIDLERARYLLSADDLFEEMLS